MSHRRDVESCLLRCADTTSRLPSWCAGPAGHGGKLLDATAADRGAAPPWILKQVQDGGEGRSAARCGALTGAPADARSGLVAAERRAGKGTRMHRSILPLL